MLRRPYTLFPVRCPLSPVPCPLSPSQGFGDLGIWRAGSSLSPMGFAFCILHFAFCICRSVRCTLSAVPFLSIAVCLVIAVQAAAQNPQPPKGRAAAKPPAAKPVPADPLGYWPLALESVRNELNFSAEQQKKLGEISVKYQSAILADREKLSELPPEQRAVRLVELQQITARRAQQMRKEVEDLLTPEQWATLKKIDFRLRAPMLLGNPATMEKLGLSDSQKEKLLQIHKDFQDKLQQIQRETGEKMIGTLTPEQQDQLQQELERQPLN